MEKYKRKIKGIYYVIDDLNWIKQQISNYYLGHEDDVGRELIINVSHSNYGEIGYVVFALNGSPPKGIAIYQPDHKFIVFINAWGKTIRTFKHTVLSNEIETQILKEDRDRVCKPIDNRIKFLEEQCLKPQKFLGNKKEVLRIEAIIGLLNKIKWGTWR